MTFVSPLISRIVNVNLTSALAKLLAVAAVEEVAVVEAKVVVVDTSDSVVVVVTSDSDIKEKMLRKEPKTLADFVVVIEGRVAVDTFVDSSRTLDI